MMSPMRIFSQHDQHAGHEILEDVLKGEPDRDRADAEAGKQAGGRQARHDHDRRDHDTDDPDDQSDERVDEVFEAGANVSLADQQVGDASGEPRHDPCDEQNDERDGKAGQGADEPFAHPDQLVLQGGNGIDTCRGCGMCCGVSCLSRRLADLHEFSLV